MLKTVFLDLDGVCVDFISGALRSTDQDVTATFERWPLGEYDVAKVIKTTDEKMWKKIEGDDVAKAYEFWSGLEEYEWFRTLHDTAREVAQDVFFLTAPSKSPGCCAGKARWLKERFGHQFDGFILTCHKELLARPDALLVDDNVKHVEEFRKAGGQSLLFPQPWNGARKYDDLKAVEDFLAQLVSL